MENNDNNDEIGVMQEIEFELSQAESPEEMDEIADSLVERGFNKFTVRKVKSKLLRKPLKRVRLPLPDDGIPNKIGKRDIIPIERDLTTLSFDGDYRQGLADGMRLLLVARKYDQMVNSEHIETLKSLVDALRSIKSESDEVATKAAREAARDVGAAILGALEEDRQKSTRLTEPLEPLYNIMGNVVANMIYSMYPQLKNNQQQLPGFTIETRKKGGEQCSQE